MVSHLKWWAAQLDNESFGTYIEFNPYHSPNKLVGKIPGDTQVTISICIFNGEEGIAEAIELPWRRTAAGMSKPFSLRPFYKRNDVLFENGAVLCFDDQRLWIIRYPLKAGEPTLWTLLYPFVHRRLLKRRRASLEEEQEEEPRKRRRLFDKHEQEIAAHHARQQTVQEELMQVVKELEEAV